MKTSKWSILNAKDNKISHCSWNCINILFLEGGKQIKGNALSPRASQLWVTALSCSRWILNQPAQWMHLAPCTSTALLVALVGRGKISHGIWSISFQKPFLRKKIGKNGKSETASAFWITCKYMFVRSICTASPTVF